MWPPQKYFNSGPLRQAECKNSEQELLRRFHTIIDMERSLQRERDAERPFSAFKAILVHIGSRVEESVHSEELNRGQCFASWWEVRYWVRKWSDSKFTGWSKIKGNQFGKALWMFSTLKLKRHKDYRQHQWGCKRENTGVPTLPNIILNCENRIEAEDGHGFWLSIE